MQTQWQKFFRLLTEYASGVVPYWRMKNGVEFHLAIPEHDDIQEKGFSQVVEFPFTFEEIESLTIQPSVGPPRVRITNDLNAVRKAASSAGGFVLEEIWG